MATPLLDIDTQHKEMIHDAQLDYYAKRLATCSSDSTVKVYDILGDQQYQFLANLSGHDGPVWEVTWAHPKFGFVLASCSFDGKVVIHREQPAGQWQQIFVYSDMKASVNSIAWAPHEFDLCLACVTSDGKLCFLSHNDNDMWSATVKDGPAAPLGLNSVSWAPYGSTAQAKERRLVTGGSDNKLHIWVSSEESGGEWRVERTLGDGVHTDWVRDVAWAPSIGLPCNTIASGSEDGKVVVWTQSDPKAEWTACVVREAAAPIWRVSWSITGSVLAVSAGDNEVTLWKEAPDENWVQISNVNEATAPVAVPAGGPGPAAQDFGRPGAAQDQAQQQHMQQQQGGMPMQQQAPQQMQQQQPQQFGAPQAQPQQQQPQPYAGGGGAGAGAGGQFQGQQAQPQQMQQMGMMQAPGQPQQQQQQYHAQAPMPQQQQQYAQPGPPMPGQQQQQPQYQAPAPNSMQGYPPQQQQRF